MSIQKFNTIVSALCEYATKQPDQVVFTFLTEESEQSLTYRDLDRKARAIAAALWSTADFGERAILLYPQGLDFIAAFLGCLYAGIVAVPTPLPALTTSNKARSKRIWERLQAVVSDAQARLVLTTSECMPQLQRMAAQFEMMSDTLWLASDTAPEAENWQGQRISDDGLAFLQYTSGSTTFPKGVMVRHRHLTWQLACYAQACAFEHDSVCCSWLPHFHDLGLVEGILLPLYAGIPCYLLDALSFIKRPILWLRAISRYRVTHSPAPNFAYDLCERRIADEGRQGLDLSCWQIAHVGAEPVRKDTLLRFAQAFQSVGFSAQTFCPGYGLAEATLIATVTRRHCGPLFRTLDREALSQNRVVAAETGLVVTGCGTAIGGQIVIVAPEKLTLCAANEIGEIWIAGGSVASGYWNRNEETIKSFHARLQGPDADAKPFLRTGDLGFIDHSELFITGRLKDLIIYHGHNYYPHDIEATVHLSHPEVQHQISTVFSIDRDAEEHLVIVQEVEHTPDNPDAILIAIKNEVAREHGLPVYAVVLAPKGSIAKTTSGKIQRNTTRTAFLEGRLPSIKTWNRDMPFRPDLIAGAISVSVLPQNPWELQLIELWQKILGVSPIGTDHNFFDLGGNSVQAANMITEVEALCHQVLPLSVLIEAPTICQLAARLQASDWSPSWRSLVPLKPNGTKTPFFYVHGVSGHVVMFANLARYFDPERPFYGLQSVGLDGKKTPFDKIEDMAAHYIREIQTIQPQGPYCIGGRCFGGIVAVEMACQLVEQNQSVGLLAAVETSITVTAPILQRINRELELLSSRQAEVFLNVRNTNRKAQAQYTPRIYRGRTAYCAAEGTAESAEMPRDWTSLLRYWKHWLKGPMEIYSLPGDHLSLDYEPHVKILAHCLGECLNRAEQEPEPTNSAQTAELPMVLTRASSHSASPAHGGFKVTALLAVRNGQMYLARCLEHLVSQGVEVFVIDNDSTDNSLEIALNFLGRGVVRIDRLPYEGYFDLTKILLYKEQLATEIDSDWFMHCDVDEIHQAPKPYATLLEGIRDADAQGCNTINFDEFAFMPANQDEDFTGRDYVAEMRSYYFFEPQPPHLMRAWKKLPRIDLHTNAGHIILTTDCKVFAAPFILRHYICLSYAHVVKKYTAMVYSPDTIKKGWSHDRRSFTADALRIVPREELKTLDASATNWDKSSPQKVHRFFGHMVKEQKVQQPLVETCLQKTHKRHELSIVTVSRRFLTYRKIFLPLKKIGNYSAAPWQ